MPRTSKTPSPAATVLFFDTETTGIPRRYDAPLTDLRNWPRPVQIAWVLCDQTGQVLQERDAIIRPEGFGIPEDAIRIHGITTERALAEGVELRAVLGDFAAAVEIAGVVVAHNMSFDESIVGAEFIRTGIVHRLHASRRVCTKEASTSFCRILGRGGRYKWPTLDELHRRLFGRPHSGSHSATGDVNACARCFFELRRLGVIR